MKLYIYRLKYNSGLFDCGYKIDYMGFTDVEVMKEEIEREYDNESNWNEHYRGCVVEEVKDLNKEDIEFLKQELGKNEKKVKILKDFLEEIGVY